MTQEGPPEIFDTLARTHARQRGTRMGDDGGFMKAEVAERLLDRLADIQRPFRDRFDLGGNMKAPEFEAVPLDDILPFEEASADLIVSNLCLHSVNDLVGTLVQAGRALRPDGFLMVSLFGGDTLQELRTCLLEAELERTGRAAQRVHPMGDIRDLGGLLSRAGLALPVADLDRITVTYDTPMKLLTDLRAMGEVNILKNRSRQFLRRDVLMTAMAKYQDTYQQADGSLPATFDVIYLSAWRPAPNQQKPLKPGSGTISFADALKAGPQGD